MVICLLKEREKIILTHSDVSEVCVIGINDEKWGQAACAAVVLKEKVNLSEDELKNFLKDKLASYKVPKKIIFIDELPKNEIGKINKIELKKIFESA
jgi:acyl-coenzyme A synthetase/AMP-(fatty) acid ligase